MQGWRSPAQLPVAIGVRRGGGRSAQRELGLPDHGEEDRAPGAEADGPRSGSGGPVAGSGGRAGWRRLRGDVAGS